MQGKYDERFVTDNCIPNKCQARTVCDKRHMQLKLLPATSKVQTDRVIVEDIPNSNNDDKVQGKYDECFVTDNCLPKKCQARTACVINATCNKSYCPLPAKYRQTGSLSKIFQTVIMMMKCTENTMNVS